MAVTRRDALKARLPQVSSPLPEGSENIPGIAPATVEHLMDHFGTPAGYEALTYGEGVSIAEAALIHMAFQRGVDEVLNYITALMERTQ